MEKKINYINTLLTAFEARNEQLHEEIKKNEKAIEEMRSELDQMLETDAIIDSIDESKVKVAA